MEIIGNKEVLPNEKKDEVLQWHFWFVVSFSLFLIVTFIYYLPLRFLHQAGLEENHMDGEEHMMMDDEMMNGGEHEGHGALAHEEESVTSGLVVNLILEQAPIYTGASITLKFFVNEKPAGIGVPASALEIEHEKLMHVIGVRDDMNEFFHIHPSPSCETLNLSDEQIKTSVVESISQNDNPWGNVEDFKTLIGNIETKLDCVLGESLPIFTVTHTFAKPGRYKIWSEIKKDGTVHSFGHKPLMVSGEGVSLNKQVSFGRSVVVNGYQVILSLDEFVVKGGEIDLSFDIHNSFGDEIEVEPYLGADMHLSIIKDDLSEFIHMHPEARNDMMMRDNHAPLHISEVRAHGEGTETPATGEDEHINFHVTFPTAGLYRAYGQFRPLGSDLLPDEALTAMFWIQVEEQAPLAFSPWWMLLVISLVLIVILSRFMRKYIGEEALK